MTNDSKLGMAAGVAGVIVAAVLLSNNAPQAVQSKPEAVHLAKENLDAQPALRPSAPAVSVAPVPASRLLPFTPVAHTRKDVEAQPASLSSATEGEP